jgi:hypothetical protein
MAILVCGRFLNVLYDNKVERSLATDKSKPELVLDRLN